MMRGHLKQMDLGGLCTFCLCKNAEEWEQNEWTAAPDHSEKKRGRENTKRDEERDCRYIELVLLNLCWFFFKANGTAGRCESWDDPS